jgi:hypothetical protein
MRKQLALGALLLAASFSGQAQTRPARQGLVIEQDKKQASPRLNPVQERARRLSDQMVRDLRLNGYQSSRLRAINEDKVAKMAAIEKKHANNPKLADEQCQGVCKERDKELKAVLSNAQYTNYYGSRSSFYKFDKDYAARSANDIFVNSVQNPSPASSGAVIAPARKSATTQTQTR